MMGNFLSSKWNKKVAVVEINDSNTFQKIQDAYCEKGHVENFGTYFQLYGLMYYYHMSTSGFPSLYNLGYEYILLDFGSNYAKRRGELLRCQSKYIIGSFTDWRKKSFRDVIDNFLFEVGGNSFTYLSLFGDEKECNKWSRQYKIAVQSIPFEPDPFTIHNKNFDFFEKILR